MATGARLLVIFALGLVLAPRCYGWELPGVPPDTSRQALTPEWAFGVWMWEDDVNTSAAVWDMVNGCAKHDLPLRAVIIDSPWATAYNNFTFDQKRYPNPRKMIQDLHARGVKVILWMTCMINLKDQQADSAGSTEDLYAIAKSKGYLCNGGKPIKWWKGEGAFIDYTNPEAVKWWHGLMDRALDLGVDGWKVDGTGELFPMQGGYGKGGPISLPQYVDMYYRDTYNHLVARNPMGVTMVRSVDAGETGYTGRDAPRDAAPVTWFGDQDHTWGDKGLMEAIRDQFLAMDKGYSVMGTDIGGYSSTPDRTIPRDLYIRWIQWSTFLPFFLNGGHDEHRPWKYDDEFLSLYRKFAWLHQELAPFYYSHVRAVHDGGPFFMKAGPGTWQYLVGDQLLVAIMYGDKTARHVVFPEGDWIDYWDNSKAYHGPSQADLEVPLGRYPVFIRAGSIIPLNVVNGFAGHGDSASAGFLTLDIYPDPAREAAFALFDERSGKTDLRCTAKADGTTVSIDGGARRRYILRIMSSQKPQQVSVTEGGRTSRLAEITLAEWAKAPSGWRFDAGDQRLWIKLAETSRARVVIDFKPQ
jgi:alpha-glucosidase (family GH31 glycosyl hydrolase)